MNAAEPDPRPGNYYVSAIDGPKYWLVPGPYTTHTAAIAKVDAARKICEQHDSRAIWFAFGTVRLHDGQSAKPGMLESVGLAP